MVEPTACAVHAARKVHCDTAVVIGSGTLGLLTVAALRSYGNVRTIIATAKYSDQRSRARALGADIVVEPAELSRAVRSHTKSMIIGDAADRWRRLCRGLRRQHGVAHAGTRGGWSGPRRDGGRHARARASRPHHPLASRDRHPWLLRLHPRRLRGSARARAAGQPGLVGQRVLSTRPLRRRDRPTPPMPGRGARSRSRSTSAPRSNARTTNGKASTTAAGLRARRRQVDPAHPVPQR